MNCCPNPADAAKPGEARRRARDTALARLLEARAQFAEEMEARYASGARTAARDSDRLEQIATRIVNAVDTYAREFERLDVARDLNAYLGPDGLKIERSNWSRGDLASAVADAFEAVLHPSACAVLSAAVRLEAIE